MMGGKVQVKWWPDVDEDMPVTAFTTPLERIRFG